MLEIIVYTTLTIIVILLIKDVFFPSEKTKIKRKKEKEEFIAKIFKDVKSNNHHFVKIIRPNDVFTINDPFVVIDCINSNKQLAVIAFVNIAQKNIEKVTIKSTKDLYELMKNKKIDTVIGKRVIFYPSPKPNV